MFQKVTLVGRVGADPEIRYTTDGTPVATFNMVTTERFKTKTGEKREESEWYRVVIWRKLAEVVSEHVKKGSLLLVEGKIKSGSYDDKEGNKRKTFEIMGNEMQILSWPDRDGQPGKSGSQRPGGSSHESDFVPEFDDDIPM